MTAIVFVHAEREGPAVHRTRARAQAPLCRIKTSPTKADWEVAFAGDTSLRAKRCSGSSVTRQLAS